MLNILATSFDNRSQSDHDYQLFLIEWIATDVPEERVSILFENSIRFKTKDGPIGAENTISVGRICGVLEI